MSRAVITKSLLTAIANAIRAKTGKSASMTPAQMASEITAIPTGGDADLYHKILSGIGTIDLDDDAISTLRNQAFCSCHVHSLTLAALVNVTLASLNQITLVATHDNDIPTISLPALTTATTNLLGAIELDTGVYNNITAKILLPSLQGASAKWINTPYQSTTKIRISYNADDVRPGYVNVYLPAYRVQPGTTYWQAVRGLAYVCATEALLGSYKDCTDLECVVLHGDGLRIGSQYFEGCTALTALVLDTRDTVYLLATNALTKTPIATGTGYIYVPDDLVDTYKAATNWVTYSSQIKPLSEYTED